MPFPDSETRWRLALDAAGDGVWDWRVQTGEEFYSDRLLHMFGFKRGYAGALGCRAG